MARAATWPDDDRLIGVTVDHAKQSNWLWVANQIMGLTQLGFSVTAQQSTDGLYHLSFTPDSGNPAEYNVLFQYPQDLDAGGTINGVAATTLSPGSNATVSLDEAGILHFGIPTGATGAAGSAGLGWLERNQRNQRRDSTVSSGVRLYSGFTRQRRDVDEPR